MELIRKIIHFSTFLFALAILYFGRDFCLPIFLCIGGIFLIFDIIRINNNSVNNFYYKYFGFISRGYEREKITSASYSMISIMLSTYFFESYIAIVSILIMSFADPMASIIGNKIGKINILNKTLEGSLSFFLFSAAILIIFNFTSYEVIVVSLSCTLSELVSKKIKIDDNLSVPIVSGTMLSFL